MARPPSLTPKTTLHTVIPLDVRTKLDLHLFSPAEGRVPYNAYSEFIVARCREFFEWSSLDLETYGFPQGYFLRGPKEMVSKMREVLEIEQTIRNSEKEIT